jgi:hypothetical protein
MIMSERDLCKTPYCYSVKKDGTFILIDRLYNVFGAAKNCNLFYVKGVNLTPAQIEILHSVCSSSGHFYNSSTDPAYSEKNLRRYNAIMVQLEAIGFSKPYTASELTEAYAHCGKSEDDYTPLNRQFDFNVTSSEELCDILKLKSGGDCYAIQATYAYIAKNFLNVRTLQDFNSARYAAAKQDSRIKDSVSLNKKISDWRNLLAHQNEYYRETLLKFLVLGFSFDEAKKMTQGAILLANYDKK